jgi:hypothetical protein
MGGNDAMDSDVVGLVLPSFACPGYGQRRLDELAWLEPDDELVHCATCGAEYAPGCDRREWLIEAVLQIGQDAGWWGERAVAERRQLAPKLTDEQLKRWYRVSTWAARVERPA